MSSRVFFSTEQQFSTSQFFKLNLFKHYTKKYVFFSQIMWYVVESDLVIDLIMQFCDKKIVPINKGISFLRINHGYCSFWQ